MTVHANVGVWRGPLLVEGKDGGSADRKDHLVAELFMDLFLDALRRGEGVLGAMNGLHPDPVGAMDGSCDPLREASDNALAAKVFLSSPLLLVWFGIGEGLVKRSLPGRWSLLRFHAGPLAMLLFA
jgi:hypothetical protein